MTICTPQRLQRTGQAASLIWRFSKIGNASLLVKYFCDNVYFSITHWCPPPILTTAAGTSLIVILFSGRQPRIYGDALIQYSLHLLTHYHRQSLKPCLFCPYPRVLLKVEIAQHLNILTYIICQHSSRC